jgi:hypothetical protein
VTEPCCCPLQATKNVAELAAGAKKLRAFVQLSTAYTNCDQPRGSHVEERLYNLSPASLSEGAPAARGSPKPSPDAAGRGSPKPSPGSAARGSPKPSPDAVGRGNPKPSPSAACPGPVGGARSSVSSVPACRSCSGAAAPVTHGGPCCGSGRCSGSSAPLRGAQRDRAVGCADEELRETRLSADAVDRLANELAHMTPEAASSRVFPQPYTDHAYKC